MAAVGQPFGQMIASEVKAGNAAEAPLYTPLIQRVRDITKRRGLLYSGDCKMTALHTRAALVAHDDFYLMPLTGETVALFARSVEAVVAGEQSAMLMWDEHTRTQDVGRGRGSVNRPQRTHTKVRYVITGVVRQEHAITARQ